MIEISPQDERTKRLSCKNCRSRNEVREIQIVHQTHSGKSGIFFALCAECCAELAQKLCTTDERDTNDTI